MNKISLAVVAMASSLAFTGVAHAAENNPFGLVYKGAIMENVKGKVNIHPVTYTLNGLKIAANVYTPAGYEATKKYPAVVVAHPNGGVKEQVAGLYAQRLAEKGYITIAADAAFQGASEGTPRNVDKPQFRTEDIHGMADYISAYPGVDANRIGALGICGGGGYTLNAAKSDKRFRAVATLSMFNSGQVRRNGYMNTQLDSIQARLKEASDARIKELAGEIGYSGNVDFDALTDESISKIPTDLYREGMIYYGQTHRHPNSTFRYTTSSLMDLMSWDATDHIELINVPLLMMAGEKADSLYMSEEAFEKATGTTDKELFLIPGATHIRTYFVPEYVDQAVAKLTEFYGKHLK
ncbi:alpha/beta hydrolase [uncultured Mailhella sp.]|uniref:alpha/beta hydrolase n=1 Tax=uncultured Mailhella sp. TaxID=1981031 RepID=UPI00262B8006|nr:alpha/beta hydrolase [uncultured Mailhella sp.]